MWLVSFFTLFIFCLLLRLSILGLFFLFLIACSVFGSVFKRFIDTCLVSNHILFFRFFLNIWMRFLQIEYMGAFEECYHSLMSWSLTDRDATNRMETEEDTTFYLKLELSSCLFTRQTTSHWLNLKNTINLNFFLYFNMNFEVICPTK